MKDHSGKEGCLGQVKDAGRYEMEEGGGEESREGQAKDAVGKR